MLEPRSKRAIWDWRCSTLRSSTSMGTSACLAAASLRHSPASACSLSQNVEGMRVLRSTWLGDFRKNRDSIVWEKRPLDSVQFWRTAGVLRSARTNASATDVVGAHTLRGRIELSSECKSMIEATRQREPMACMSLLTKGSRSWSSMCSKRTPNTLSRRPSSWYLNSAGTMWSNTTGSSTSLFRSMILTSCSTTWYAQIVATTSLPISADWNATG